MCNQCEDMRRIHGEQVVWIIMKDKKPLMQFKTRKQADRAIRILWAQEPEAFWQIVQDSSKITRWEA